VGEEVEVTLDEVIDAVTRVVDQKIGEVLSQLNSLRSYVRDVDDRLRKVESQPSSPGRFLEILSEGYSKLFTRTLREAISQSFTIEPVMRKIDESAARVMGRLDESIRVMGEVAGAVREAVEGLQGAVEELRREVGELPAAAQRAVAAAVAPVRGEVERLRRSAPGRDLEKRVEGLERQVTELRDEVRVLNEKIDELRAIGVVARQLLDAVRRLERLLQGEMGRGGEE